MSPSLLADERGFGSTMSPQLSHHGSGIYDYRMLASNTDVSMNSIDGSGLSEPSRRAQDEVRFAREVAELQKEDYSAEQS